MEILIPLVIAYFLLSGSDKSKKSNPIPSPNPTPQPGEPISDPVFPPMPTDVNPNIPNPTNPTDTYNPIKDRFDADCKRLGTAYKIPWQMLKAHIAVETEYGTTPAVMQKQLGAGNKRGILGITEATFFSINRQLQGSWKPEDLWKQEVSIEIAAAIIKSNTISITKDSEFFTKEYGSLTQAQMDTKRNQLAKIVMSYNAGAGAVLNNNISQNTKNYLSKWVLAFDEIQKRQGK